MFSMLRHRVINPVTSLCALVLILAVFEMLQAATIEIRKDVPLVSTRVYQVWPEGLQAWEFRDTISPGISLNAGDNLAITIDFIGSSLKVADLGLMVGCGERSPCKGEGIFFALAGSGLIPADTSSAYSFEFVSPTGDLSINPVNEMGIFRNTSFGLQATTNSAQTWDILPELTASFFQFGGVHFVLSMPETLSGSWQPIRYNLGVLADKITVVPEPATALLLGSGFIGLAGYGRKKFFKQ